MSNIGLLVRNHLNIFFWGGLHISPAPIDCLNQLNGNKMQMQIYNGHFFLSPTNKLHKKNLLVKIRFL